MEDESKKKTRCTNKQKEAMVNYMASHTLFAHGEYTGPLGQRKHKDEWEKLKDHLNQLGPAKSLISWQRTWRDLKKKARWENAQYRRDIEKTGNSTTPIPVGETSQKVLGVIGMASSTGIGAAESCVQSVDCPVYTIPSSPIPSKSSPVSFDYELDVSSPAETSPPPNSAHSGQEKRPALAASTSTRSGPPRTRTAPPSAATASVFATLQRETNTLLQVLIKEVKRSNVLKTKHNAILAEQNLILKQTRTAKFTEISKDLDTVDDQIRAEASTPTSAEVKPTSAEVKPTSPEVKRRPLANLIMTPAAVGRLKYRVVKVNKADCFFK